MLLCLSGPVHAAPEILVPAYFDPSTAPNLWSQLSSAAATVPLTVIMNPDSGPGTAADPSYSTAVGAVRGNGGKVVGYVSTQFGARTRADAQGDVDRYLSFYPDIDGIFLDEMSTDTGDANLAYYLDLYNYIKGRRASLRVIGNPGTNTPEAYLARADVLVIFEDPQSAYAGATPDAYVANYPSTRFAMIAFDQPGSAGMVSDLELALSRNTGIVYVTDDREVLPDFNPYDTLPSYWSAEVNAVASRQPAPPPTGESGDEDEDSGGGALGGLSLLLLLVVRQPFHRRDDVVVEDLVVALSEG